MNRMHWLVLTVIISGAILVRLYRINSPVADWHSWRQADTAAVSRNFVKYGFDLLRPRYDDISSTQTGYFNPHGLRLVEFPLYNAVVAALFLFFGVHEIYARVVSLASSILTLVCIYILVRVRLGPRAALTASGFFAFFPYNIYFSRAIFPENFALALAMASIVCMDVWARVVKTRWLLAAASLAALALLAKLTVAFILLPLVYLAWQARGWRMFCSPLLWAAAAITLSPIVWWRWWISHFPEGIPANTWLLNGGGIRFKGAWFRWIFAERISKMIFGYFGVPFFVNGIISRIRPKEGWLFVIMLAGSLLYLTVFARGNIQHDYYQILIIPSLAIMAAKGAELFFDPPPAWHRRVTIPAFIVLVCLSVAFGWYEIRGNYNINHPEIIRAGQAVDRLSAPDALVVAPYDGDTAFLYQTKRAGWPSYEGTIEELVARGADIYVSVRFDDGTKKLATSYATLAKTDEYVMLDLQNPIP